MGRRTFSKDKIRRSQARGLNPRQIEEAREADRQAAWLLHRVLEEHDVAEAEADGDPSEQGTETEGDKPSN